MKLVVATLNRGKFREIEQSLIFYQLIPLWTFPDITLVEEDQPTFAGNALKKAKEVCLQTGLPTLADDSGLVVNALGGRPGVRSARYAGLEASDQKNNQKLLEEMRAVPQSKRGAHYVCALVLRFPEGKEIVIEERCEGEILEVARGSGGFGYDPLFSISELGKTMAELPLEVKNRISHRGKALRRLNLVISGSHGEGSGGHRIA